jgi:DNA-binding HxlR family transcriptional regulator
MDAAFDTTQLMCASYTRAVEIIGRRWTGAILRALLSGETRFGGIKAAIPGISDRLLSQRLKELEAEHVVERQVTASTPVSIRYRLTERGEALMPVLESVASWAVDWLEPPAPSKKQATRRRPRASSSR